MPDPFRGHNFLIEIDGITEAGFQECSGLDSSTDAVDYREGSDPGHVRKLMGLNKFSAITLKRGVTDSQALWNWRQKVLDGKPDEETRRNVSIVLLNEARQERGRWNLRRAWPSKYTGPTLNATSNDVAVEALEITHEEVWRP